MKKKLHLKLMLIAMGFSYLACSQNQPAVVDTHGIYPIRSSAGFPPTYSPSRFGYYKPARSVFCELEKKINPKQKRWLAFRLGSFEQSNLLEYGPLSHHYQFHKEY
ncbi:MAG: hypothetical protein IPM34_09335 [Saprospiraceae bacterium]|nr:hypothetical protein [Saprospiraceae bacterium]